MKMDLSKNKTYLEVFRLLRAALFPADGEQPQHLEDWNAVFREMQAQSVAALPYAWLKEQRESEPEVYSAWLTRCLQSQARWVKVMSGQSQLLALLEENGIECVILKGAAAAMAYPNPSLRQMGDVDFLVRRSDRDRAAAILEENGYSLEHEKDEKSHHYGYTKGGISFELHWRIGVVHDSNEKLLSLFEEGIARREIRETGAFSFPVLPVELNGLALVFHINQHLRSGLGLRQIIDWMMYVDQLSDAAGVWTEKLRPLLRETGMEKLALCVSVMCQRFLGLPKTLDGCETVDPAVCGELMSYIMEKGNFGRKSGKTGKISSVYLDMSNPFRVIKRLQKGGMTRWKAAKKHRILRPFAWAYQAGSIRRELKRNHISAKEMSNQHAQGVRQRELMKALGLDVERSIGARTS